GRFTLDDAQLAVAEPADERRPPGQDAQFTVVHRHGDEVDRLVEHGAFGGDYSAFQWSRHVLPRGLLRLLGGLFDATDVHERVLRQVIPFAVAELFEAPNRVRERRDFARFVGKRFGDDERL